eukprot:scaffold16761_cov72-Skeletonema_dohrnii-CCMP3373.AAC.1
MAADGWHIYNAMGVIPPGVTRVRIHESLTVIPAYAFNGNIDIEEVECHVGVKTVKERAFQDCPFLRRVIMRGVEVVEHGAFAECYALTDVECDKLERIERCAFGSCRFLRSINLPSAEIVGVGAFAGCTALTNVKFGKELESIGDGAFVDCTSLERITIPLKDDMITADNIFTGCKKLKQVDLVEGEILRDTIDALLLDEWRNNMKDEIGVINQILPNTSAGDNKRGKARAMRMWIRSVLHNIIRYKYQHRSLLNEYATAVQHAFPKDIVLNNSFLSSNCHHSHLKGRIMRGEEEGDVNDSFVGDLDKEKKEGGTKRRGNVFLWRSCDDDVSANPCHFGKVGHRRFSVYE